MEEKRPIIIQGAMRVEIKYFLENLKNCSKIQLEGYNFYKGTIKNFPIVISETQIGSLNSTIATTIGILNFKPRAIINQGIAGAYGKEIHKFDLVFGTKVVNTNSYKSQKKVEGKGSDPLDWQLITFTSDDDENKEEIKLEADKTLLSIAKETNYIKGKVHFGVIGSGDMWNRETDRIMWIKEHTGAMCGDMESIGAYTVCSKLNVPVLGIRVMSDNEILNEEYDRETAKEAQKITLEFVEKYIERIA